MDMELYFPNMTSTLQISGCGFGVKPPGWSYPNHHHHLFELLYCFGGEAVHYTNGMATPLREGDWIWIKSGVKHRMENASDAPYSFFNVHFDIDDPELRKTLSARDYGLLTGSEAKRTKLPGYMERIEQLMSDGMTKEPQQHSGKLPPLRLGPATKIELQACILLLIHQITGYVAEREPLPAQHMQPVSAASALETDIAHAVEERLQQMALAPAEQTITQIADQLHISRSQCTKTFTKVYGVSPRRYVSRLIENRAKLLLVTTSMSVEDISLELGFRSLSHFSRQFRRWTGVSPMQYRPKRE
ncbi:AraC family transcriptional regulator [Paenibacillus ginsengarvi]|uniref:AraC family transcriptional regulator n=1 Tax=Paenibacillus ginsengarvi TaxID=400777 RepID=A0A3B0CT55_9BACL|nr:helix-turn-helix domain-containing protein [Paenibacillus ginsengarvi]RKN86970.1 AraC family transcriptional regulator [Paenibacillus ginsengarvi]